MAFLELDSDMILEIIRADQWLSSGPLARTCKQFLHLFISAPVLKELLTSLKDTNQCLLKWLTIALPSFYFTPLTLDLVKSVRERTLTPRLTSTCFVTGGHVCQALYTKQWFSDIDIYVSKEYCSERYQINNLDILPSILPELEQVVGSFDLSIVQQGFLGEQLFLTPLAFHTYMNREIIAMPSATNIVYPDGDPNKIVNFNNSTADIWKAIERHFSSKEHQLYTFDSCSHCSVLHKDIDKWRQRITRYVSRFPSFTIVYLKPWRSESQ